MPGSAKTGSPRIRPPSTTGDGCISRTDAKPVDDAAADGSTAVTIDDAPDDDAGNALVLPGGANTITAVKPTTVRRTLDRRTDRATRETTGPGMEHSSGKTAE